VPQPLRQHYRRSLGIPVSARIVVFAARYDGMKNVPLLLAAARDFLDRDPRGHVILCGAGMARSNPELRADIAAAFADARPRLSRLHRLGLRNDMPAVYAAADVVALTSSNGEAAPLCLIEGMMCGAIPVATDVGDCTTIVDGHGIITGSDPRAISAAWTEAVARRAEWTPALRASRPRFSLVRMTAAYGSLIEAVATNRVVPARA
jgi:glycosyltransferase involved in cell wall biosynthesis